MLARLGQADGQLCNSESAEIDRFLATELGMLTPQKLKAMRIFAEARHSTKSFEACAREFNRRYRWWPCMRSSALDLLISLAHADNRFQVNEHRQIKAAARIFGYDDKAYREAIESFKARQTWRENLQSTFGDSNWRSHAGGSYARDNFDRFNSEKTSRAKAHAQSKSRTSTQKGWSSVPHDSYAILRCKPTDDFKHIQKRYRKLVKKYHPDMLRNAGMPEEMMSRAEERFLIIQNAWEEISAAKRG